MRVANYCRVPTLRTTAHFFWPCGTVLITLDYGGRCFRGSTLKAQEPADLKVRNRKPSSESDTVGKGVQLWPSQSLSRPVCAIEAPVCLRLSSYKLTATMSGQNKHIAWISLAPDLPLSFTGQGLAVP